MKHALVIGGTGMLAGVSRALARGHLVSVVSRTASGMRRLAASCVADAVRLRHLDVDYHATDLLALRIVEAIERDGPVTVAVSWIHSTAPHAPAAVARSIVAGNAPCRFIDVLGSAFVDESPRIARREAFRQFPSIDYCQVRLGFVVEASRSRWLTHEEISGGVLDALAGTAGEHTIGTVLPWSARP